MQRIIHDLSVTTQGPTYPPSEIMDPDGNFIVIGRVNRAALTAGASGGVTSPWGAAIVAADSPVPPFGVNFPYRIVRELDPDALSEADRALVLHTLPLPLPCHNYPMVFAPAQRPDADRIRRPSYALHAVPIPDLRPEDGRKRTTPITLGDWVQARGQVEVTVADDARSATFAFRFAGLVPDTLYTIMSLRQRDLDPRGPTRPGPLGIPNVFIADARGDATYTATLPDPFPAADRPGANRIVNVVILWMSHQMSHGGAIGLYGLGGDIHAQLKLRQPSFFELETRP